MKKENRLIIIMGVLSFLSVFIFDHDEQVKLTWPRFTGVMLVVAAICVAALFWKRLAGFRNSILAYVLTGAAVLSLQQITNHLRVAGLNDHTFLTMGSVLVGAVLLAAFACVVWGKKDIGQDHVLWLIFLIFMLRLFFQVLTQAHFFQNDVYGFNENEWGHLGYVYQLFTTGGIPDVNPMEHYQLYQPPLHYVICAGLVHVFQALGLELTGVDEYLQMLSLFYSVVTLVFIDKIGKQMNISEFGRFIIIGLCGFLPYGFIMSGALNNDPLMTLFMVMAVYFTMKWYQEPNFRNIIIMAVCIGCAMMSKVSGALVAPAMAVVMLMKAWQMRKEWLTILKQFVCFGCIAFPLGLWHPISRLIRYGMPIGFVPELDPALDQFIGNINKSDRFLNFEGALDKLSIQWGYGESFADYNIWTTLWKFGVFGETAFYDNNPVTQNVAMVTFYLTGILALALLAGTVLFLFARKQQVTNKILLIGSAGAIGIMFLKFCIMYPFICTMNIRYIMVAVYFMMIMLGAGAATGLSKRTEGSKQALVYRGLVGTMLALYSIFSFLLYWNLQMLIL